VADIYDTSKRSALMSRVRGAGNRATELRLIEIFRATSITGWRRKQPLPGRPDFVFRRERVVVFVDGCFWHCCPKHGSLPITNRSFWRKKLEGNVARDKLVSCALRKCGWRVLRVWQHELKKSNEPHLVGRLKKAGLTSSTGSP
jgi:DNA mismatch endonuclease (patch repair protein)